MTNEQRFFLFEDMYLSESVMDILHGIINRLLNFLKKLKTRFFGEKLDKAINKAEKDPNIKNKVYKMPKGFNKVTKEVTSKFKDFCSRVKRSHGGNLVAPAALSAMALSLISSASKTYEECTLNTIANASKDLKNMQKYAFKDLNDYYSAINDNLQTQSSLHPKDKKIKKEIKYQKRYQTKVYKIADDPEKTKRMMKVMPEIQKYTKILQYLSLITTTVFLGSNVIYGNGKEEK